MTSAAIPADTPRDSALADQFHPAANAEGRRGRFSNGRPPDMLILHYTGMTDVGKALEWLTRADSKVSCHYLVAEDGVITQMVPESLRAWHAGVSSWAGKQTLTRHRSASRSITLAMAPGRDQGMTGRARP